MTADANRRSSGRRAPHPTDAGFLVLDALVGLLVVAMGMVAVVQAQAMIQQMNRSAVELRQGAAEALFRLDAEWPRLARQGAVSGSAPAFDWSVAASPVASALPAPLALCKVVSSVRFKGTGKTVAIATQRLCSEDAT